MYGKRFGVTYLSLSFAIGTKLNELVFRISIFHVLEFISRNITAWSSKLQDLPRDLNWDWMLNSQPMATTSMLVLLLVSWADICDDNCRLVIDIHRSKPSKGILIAPQLSLETVGLIGSKPMQLDLGQRVDLPGLWGINWPTRAGHYTCFKLRGCLEVNDRISV